MIVDYLHDWYMYSLQSDRQCCIAKKIYYMNVCIKYNLGMIYAESLQVLTNIWNGKYLIVSCFPSKYGHVIYNTILYNELCWANQRKVCLIILLLRKLMWYLVRSYYLVLVLSHWTRWRCHSHSPTNSLFNLL